jgi:sulfite dehydrogenase (quinone) subunit SoeC
VSDFWIESARCLIVKIYKEAGIMKEYDWMVKPTPQREWIEQRGILLWLAFFFIELGAGAFFVASFFQSSKEMLIPMLAGWLVCGLLGGGIHVLYLGHPSRAWRILLNPGTSWISRGLIFVALYLLLGLVYILLYQLAGFSSTALLIASDVLAFLVIIYGGFAMNYVKGISLWNTALLPVLYVVSGIWGGAGIALSAALAASSTTIGVSVEEWIRILIIGYIVLLTVYLISVRYSNLVGTYSVRQMLTGRWWPWMWVVVVGLGLLVPTGVIITSYLTGLKNIAPGVLYLSVFCEMAGDITMRYLILKCGFYGPLITSSNQMA